MGNAVLHRAKDWSQCVENACEAVNAQVYGSNVRGSRQERPGWPNAAVPRVSLRFGSLAMAVCMFLTVVNCKSPPRSIPIRPQPQRPVVSTNSAATDGFLAREPAQMAVEDQQRAEDACADKSPARRYRDSPLIPPPRR